MSLDLVVLTPGSAREYAQALRVYHEEEAGEPSEAAMQAFADEVSARYGDEDWPFTGNPIVFPEHLLLSIGHERSEERRVGKECRL